MSEIVPAGGTQAPARKLDRDLEHALLRVWASDHADHVKAALRAVAEGSSVTSAAEEHGCSRPEISRLACRYGITPMSRIQAVHRATAAAAAEGVLERVLEDPDSLSTTELSVLSGISTDKMLAFEKLQIEREKLKAATSGHDLNAILSEMATTLQAGERVRLGITIEKQRDQITIEAETSE